MRRVTRAQVNKIVKSKKGLLLDISLGGTPQPRAVTMGPAGDLQHDPLSVPFPLPSACVHTAVVTHVLEYLPPDQWFAWWDELWRVMQPLGIVYCSGPYGGDDSQGWVSDPTHRTRVIEQSFAWFDPRTPMWPLHTAVGRAFPRPWYPQTLARIPGANGTISYNVATQAQPMSVIS